MEKIEKIHKKKEKETYGAVNLQAELANDGIQVSVNRIRRIMRKNNIRAVVRKKKHRYPKDKKSNQPVADNILNRDFTAENKNEKWVSDITYIPTRQGWLYLCIIMDLYSRRIVGWAMDKNMKTDLVLSALDMAVNLRGIVKGLIFHSDQGSQYRSNAFRNKLSELEFIQSMSRKGNCWDNAVAESLFKTIKYECTNRYLFLSYVDAYSIVNEYVKWYNAHRLHSALDYKTPLEMEVELRTKSNKIVA